MRGVFVLLAASLDMELVRQLDLRAVLFVILVAFVARPLAVWLSLAGTGLPWQEKLIVALIAPRGIVEIKGMGEVETWWLTGRSTAV